MSHTPTFIDLFAGVGGMRLGFEQAGARCVFSSDLDRACQETYEANFGERPVGDICDVASGEIPDHDILVGGFPCQPFSIIGEGRGFADIRGTLFFEVERILRDKRPSALLLENVRQLVSHDSGRTFAVIVERLTRLGYHLHWKVLNGLNFGVPQKRERVIIVGFLEDVPFSFPTRSLRPTKSLDEVLLLSDCVPDKHFISPRIRAKLKKKVPRAPFRPAVWHENKAGNIGIHPFSCALRANASYNYLTVNGERRLTPREMFRLQGYPDTFQIVVSDCQARKQAGNSVVVPKIEAVATELLAALKRTPIEQQTIFANDTEPAPILTLAA